MTETTKKPLTLKLDAGTKQELKKLAKQDNRTLHGYIVNILKTIINQNKNWKMTATPPPINPEPHEPVTLCDITEEMQKLEANTLLMFWGFW